MLIRKLQTKDLQPCCCFKILQANFEAVSYRLAAEFILLYDRPDMENFLLQLKNAMDFECVFNAGDIDNDFIRDGRFVMGDRRIVGRKLYDSLTSFWLRDGNKKLTTYRDFFYNQFFEKLCRVENVPQDSPMPTTGIGKIGGFGRYVEFELLRNLICGKITKGDGVLNILFPYSEPSDTDIAKVGELYHYYFLRLFDRRANDIVLVENDLRGSAFVLAF